MTAKTGEGAVEAIRLLKVARDTAVTAHSQAMITLKATLVTASDTSALSWNHAPITHWSPPAPPWRSPGISPTRRWRCAMRSGRWPAGG